MGHHHYHHSTSYNILDYGHSQGQRHYKAHIDIDKVTRCSIDRKERLSVIGQPPGCKSTRRVFVSSVGVQPIVPNISLAQVSLSHSVLRINGDWSLASLELPWKYQVRVLSFVRQGSKPSVKKEVIFV
jgi:hypothetical protein